MGFSLKAALAADFQGQRLLTNLEQEKAQTQQIEAQTQFQKMQTLTQQKKLQGQEEVGKWIAANQQAEAAPGQTTVDIAQKYQKGATQMAAQGNMYGYTMLGEMASKEIDRAKDMRIEMDKKQAALKETAAQAAIAYQLNQSPENEKIVVQAAMAAGVNPVNLPPPGTPAFGAFVRQQATSAMTSKDQLAAAEKAREFDTQFEERKAENKRRDEDRDAQRQQTAAFQQGNLALRADSLEVRKLLATNMLSDREEKKATAAEKTEFKEATKLTNDAQATAKPYLRDLSMVKNVKGLLAAGGSPAGDKQVQQALTSIMGNVGKATNLYYKDNKNFGNVAEKLEGFVSQTFTGRYSDAQRQQIFEMVDKMEKTVLEPALTNIEKDAKAKAKLFKIDPEKVSINGDFERRSKFEAGNKPGSRSVSGEITETPQGNLPGKSSTQAAPVIQDGTVIINRKTNQKMVMQNGSWVPQ